MALLQLLLAILTVNILYLANGFSPYNSLNKQLTRNHYAKMISPKYLVQSNKPADFKLSASSADSNDLNLKNESHFEKHAKVYQIAGLVAALAVIAYVGTGHLSNVNIPDLLKQAISRVESLGPYGYVYFAAVFRFFLIRLLYYNKCVNE